MRYGIGTAQIISGVAGRTPQVHGRFGGHDMSSKMVLEESIGKQGRLVPMDIVQLPGEKVLRSLFAIVLVIGLAASPAAQAQTATQDQSQDQNQTGKSAH